jgi:DNA adenine methylase
VPRRALAGTTSGCGDGLPRWFGRDACVPECVDFESVPLEDADFVYADPPFDVEFTQYAKEGFGWEEQVRTAEWLARHKGPVVLSNQATDRIMALYRKMGFRLRFLDGPRRISCTGDRTPAREVLAVRNVESG